MTRESISPPLRNGGSSKLEGAGDTEIHESRNPRLQFLLATWAREAPYLKSSSERFSVIG